MYNIQEENMFKKSIQVVKFEQNLCNAKVDDNSVLFVRVNDLIKDADALLEVPISHNAFLIKGGGDLRFYKSGTYPIFDNRKEIKNWKKGISVEVVYIPKDTSVVIFWGTPNKVQYRDSISNKVISVGARGQFGISIANPEQFFRKVVGVKKEFDLDDFSERFSAAVVDDFADCFLTIVNDQNLVYDQFDLNRKKIAKAAEVVLSERFEKSWGITLVDFIIEQFAISEEDVQKVENVADELKKAREREKEEEKREAKFKKIMDELERLSDKQWEREKYLKQLEQEDKFAYYEVLKVIGKTDVNGKSGGANFCPKCGHSCETTSAYCSHCGAKLKKTDTVCGHCGKVNPGDAVFCGGCGKKL